jgi:hypothetical protein
MSAMKLLTITLATLTFTACTPGIDAIPFNVSTDDTDWNPQSDPTPGNTIPVDEPGETVPDARWNPASDDCQGAEPCNPATG